MSRIFPKSANHLPAQILIFLVVLGGVVTAGVTYYMTPKYTRIGYAPVQPPLANPAQFSIGHITNAIVAEIVSLNALLLHNMALQQLFQTVDQPLLTLVAGRGQHLKGE